MKPVYLDNAAATPIAPEVQKAMVKVQKKYGNPSSFNDTGRSAREEIELARLNIARFLSAKPQEIIFTSSGSESNNLALGGTEGIVLTTPIEHPSVLEPLKRLDTKFVPIGYDGILDLKKLIKMLTPDCSLVSVMYANNEIGTIQPIRQIGKIIKDFNKKNNTHILFHVDACQATGFLDMNVQHLGADLLSFNGSKIYGPRGVGVLYVRRGIKIKPLIFGGSQEQGRRAGTENTPAIVGLAKALSIIKKKEAQIISDLRDYAIEKIKKFLPDILINGAMGEDRLANNISICVPNMDSENLLLELDQHSISAGSGSACTSHAVEPSHVLKAIGVPGKYINGALRFSLGRETTKKDIDYLIRVLNKIIPDLANRYARLR
jgi:cysteine desulfurase